MRQSEQFNIFVLYFKLNFTLHIWNPLYNVYTSHIEIINVYFEKCVGEHCMMTNSIDFVQAENYIITVANKSGQNYEK